MAELTPQRLVASFAALAEKMDAERDTLCRLDGVIGDADHGIAMAQGMAAASGAAADLPEGASLQDVFNAAAKAFLNAVGASSGPLYATAFLRAGKAAGPHAAMPLAETPSLIAAMAEGIAARGKAEPGQKTMLDAWAPAAEAARRGDDLVAISAVAHAGAEATAEMIATLGRAARLGERSRGHRDPGAVSAAMIIAVMAESWSRPDGA
ncbi:dihydroxyacetone kinase subunit DhaL [Albidovulum sediminicola]|uniref:Dihydroxyacetone kinase subunit DhaL n=1 Tax=Albidovulum sediminicola TaxID=2984331 RepID=A0ABT2Z254_9RHOB|nr:dihydroxyacetone kinase subunit DhaL [Defluviimonas sp. WL0075]MCV2865087.1 dihydroxyacetone kinase subunit DhaL [Defluviimonas sp. WL0075]